MAPPSKLITDCHTHLIIMGRHGKNQTASAVYSYHEKKKDTG